MKHPKPNTLAYHIHSIVTDFIWLKASDIERMLYIYGCNYSQESINSTILFLYKRGFLIRRDHTENNKARPAYTYMRTPKKGKTHD